jgi:hypothetical protein
MEMQEGQKERKSQWDFNLWDNHNRILLLNFHTLDWIKIESELFFALLN